MSIQKKRKKPADEIANTVLLDLMQKNADDEENDPTQARDEFGNIFLGVESGADNEELATRLDVSGSNPVHAKKAGIVSANEAKTQVQPRAKQSADIDEKTAPLYRKPQIPDDNEGPNATVLAHPRKNAPPSEVKVSVGSPKAHPKTHVELHIHQSENLRVAQERISELELEVDKIRQENELLTSAGELGKNKVEELSMRIHALEKEKLDLVEQNQVELKIFRDAMEEKEREATRLQAKVTELEFRLAGDLKKIRVRERELENRLELSKVEKSALVKSKDESILELKRKVDHLHLEADNYKTRIAELNRQIESNQDQFGRTVRALRLALTNLEVKESVPLKKAE